MNEECKLCFIKNIGLNLNGEYQYEFIFSENVNEFWGENFEYSPCCLCNELLPHEEYCHLVKTVKLSFPLTLIQESCCFSMQDCMDGIISLAYAYDDDNTKLLNIKYGESFNDVEIKLAKLNVLWEMKN